MVYLTAVHLEYISERYTDSLYITCLKAMRAEYDISQLADQIETLSGNR